MSWQCVKPKKTTTSPGGTEASVYGLPSWSVSAIHGAGRGSATRSADGSSKATVCLGDSAGVASATPAALSVDWPRVRSNVNDVNSATTTTNSARSFAPEWPLGKKRLDDRVDVFLLGHHDQRVHHAEHTGRAFDVREDVAVERPHSWPVNGDQRVVALTRIDAQRVALEGSTP